MTNNNFANFLGHCLTGWNITPRYILENSGVLKYNGTTPSSTDESTRAPWEYFQSAGTAFGEAYDASLSNTLGIFLTLGTDDTPPTHSDLKLGNSVEDFVCDSSNKSKSGNLLMFNSVVIYKGSSPIIIKEMGLNCVVYGQKFLLARETIEPLVINPDDTYSFVMRIK